MGPEALHPSTRLSPARASAFAMVGTAVATSPPTLAVFAGNASTLAWVAMLTWTALLAWLVARWALSARALAGALVRVLGGGVLAGWLNSVLCFLACVALTPQFARDYAGSLSVLPIVVVFGLPIGGSIGLVYGLAFVIPVLVTRKKSSRPGPDAADRSLLGVGIWAAVLTLGTGLAILPDPGRLGLHGYLAWLCTVLPLGVGGLAAGTAVLAFRGLCRRRRWLRRVRAGSVPGWVVSSLDAWRGDELRGVESLLPTRFPDAVLASVVEGEGYREASRLRPWALVPEN
jgi:hypothetical protein